MRPIKRAGELGFTRKNLLIALFAACTLLIGVIIISKIVKSRSDTPRSTADTFVGYIMKSDATKSYEMFSVSAKKADSTKSWADKMSKIKGFYSNQEFKKSIKAAAETTVVYQATGKDGMYLFYVIIVSGQNSGYQVSSFTAAPGIFTENTK